MKKILFGSASAILAVVGLSAFKTAKTTATTYYWLDVIQNVSTGTVNLAKTTEAGIVTVNGGIYSGVAATTLLFATAITAESNPLFSVCDEGSKLLHGRLFFGCPEINSYCRQFRSPRHYYYNHY